jgi:hypothetical protein
MAADRASMAAVGDDRRGAGAMVKPTRPRRDRQTFPAFRPLSTNVRHPRQPDAGGKKMPGTGGHSGPGPAGIRQPRRRKTEHLHARYGRSRRHSVCCHTQAAIRTRIAHRWPTAGTADRTVAADSGVRRTCTNCGGEQAEPGHRRRLEHARQPRQAATSASASSLGTPLTASPSPGVPELPHHQKLSARAPGRPERQPPCRHRSCRDHQSLRYRPYCRRRRWHRSNRSNRLSRLSRLSRWRPADPPGQGRQSRLLASPPSVGHTRSKPGLPVLPKKRSSIS